MTGSVAGERQWFGHPRQLARLFTTEMWERFGYYGMRALLALFLAEHFLFGDTTVGGLYGGFTSLVYLTPLFGGLIADRIMGSKRSVKLGALLMAVGYLGLCFHGPVAKPVFSYGGQTYDLKVEKRGEDKVQSVVVPGRGAYEIKGNDDGSLTLLGNDGAVLPKVLPKDSYESDGVRNPFWVSMMLLSLSAIIIGNGFFKPNISTIVGSLYAADDPRRDGGFTIFYMGINLGSIISQFFCPLLAIWYGYEAGFALAAVGMFIAWALFQFDGGRLNGYGEPPAGSGARTATFVTLGALAAIPVAWFLLDNTMVNAAAAADAAKAGTGFLGYIASLPLLGQVMFSIFFAAVIGIPVWAWRVGTKQEFHMMVVATVLIIFTVVFWTLFEQAGSSLTLFAERNTDRDILGIYTMPAGQAQIFNPLFVVIFAPIFSLLWVWLDRKGLNPPTPYKFVIALVLVGLGFLVLVWGGGFADAEYRVPLFWLAFLYLLQTLGELCLSPVGLSMVTKLAMARVVGLMMGVFFMASAMAQYVGGIVAQFASVETVGGEVTNPKLSLETYLGVFQTIGIGSLVVAGVLLLLSPWLTKWMHGVR
ncbi:peptide MFS transporter [Sandaracinobacteroides saxicola]|uniref:MFS transporter n=1 Tax=Sandaracinobacteroides saxicola TaxID=2759707 RepID=A0A7G5IDT5_9SPHN|nr:oligopeptide:H+ symporter [Sandaracinobacteroides saxicola]QMW21527.1 MFS transporter [Sandaracinobacteroides saxicola]